MILRAYKYRIFPTKEQEVLLAKHFGCSRWIYNYALNKKVKAYQTTKESLSRFAFSKNNTAGIVGFQACGDERLPLSVKQEAPPIGFAVGG